MKEEKKVTLLAVGIIIGLAAVAALIYFFFSRRPVAEPVIPEAAVVEEEKPAAEEETAGESITPLPFPSVSLEESDPAVREAAFSLSNHPLFSDWLKAGNLARKFVAAVDNVANGQSPAAHIDFFKPDGKFLVALAAGGSYIDPRSYTRYDPAARVLVSLDTVQTMKLYGGMKPLLQEAYADLGYPGISFENTLILAIKELLRTPVVTGNIRVMEKITTYEMADPYLESLSNAQKHFLRMGPDNVRAVQAKLREFAALLGVTAAGLPAPKSYQAR